jgi:hypothetical protein
MTGAKAEVEQEGTDGTEFSESDKSVEAWLPEWPRVVIQLVSADGGGATGLWVRFVDRRFQKVVALWDFGVLEFGCLATSRRKLLGRVVLSAIGIEGAAGEMLFFVPKVANPAIGANIGLFRYQRWSEIGFIWTDADARRTFCRRKSLSDGRGA